MKKRFLFLFLLSVIFCKESFSQIPVLNSRPGSGSVLFLDFDGHSDSSGYWDNWGYSNPIVSPAYAYFSTAQYTEVFNRVAEDFRPFNINITTSEAVYNSALSANRQRIVITSASGFYTDVNGGAGGVAYLTSFGDGEIAGYVFPNGLGNGAKAVAEACTHEAGHTLGLYHQSQYNSSCAKVTEYNPGLGSGQTSWAPIMGAGYTSNVTQWYNGPSTGATCTSTSQNDLDVITTTNGFGYIADDAGNTIGTATALSFSGSVINRTGLITTGTDVDVYQIVVPTAGFYSFSVSPYSALPTDYSGANVDLKLTLSNSAGVVQTLDDPSDRLDSKFIFNVAAGTYYLTVEAVGIPGYVDFGGLGPNDYGSLGQYNLQVAPYCIPTYGTACTSGDFINSYSFGGITNSGTGCNGLANNYTINSTIPSTILRVGIGYPISISSGLARSQFIGVWIDFNDDKDFNDAGEFVFNGSATAGTTLTGTIAIPNNPAFAGLRRVRVRSSYDGGGILSTQSCSYFTYGETEDYFIQIGLFYPGTINSENETICSNPGDPSRMDFIDPPSGSESFRYAWYYKAGIAADPTGSSTAGWTYFGNALVLPAQNTLSLNPDPGLTASRTFACFVQPWPGTTGAWATGARRITVLPFSVSGIPMASSAPIVTNQVITLAGSGAPGSSDVQTGTVATFNTPNGVAVDAAGNVYVADTENNKIRKITPSSRVSTLAGSGTAGSTNGTGSAALFNKPTGVAVDASGNVYVADTENNKFVRSRLPE
jgi:hypothetical protein